jgi:MFS transporter, SHS family, lactate transporter
MEAIETKARGFVSGLLQAGYPSGFLISALVFGYLYPVIGWRGMFVIGVIPAAFLILYIYALVPESRHFDRQRAKSGETAFTILREHGRVALFAILLMTGFNFFSHGTQDLYTTFLRVQHGFDPDTVKDLLVIGNIGAIAGGLFFGSFSQRFGRRRTMILVTLLSLPIIYFWSHGSTFVALAAGAFLMQVCVQGAWGVVPAHLNEIAPAAARGTFAGTCYQLGNLIAAVNNPLQSSIAARTGGNYSFALMIVAACAALTIAVLAWLGPEAHSVTMEQKILGGQE